KDGRRDQGRPDPPLWRLCAVPAAGADRHLASVVRPVRPGGGGGRGAGAARAPSRDGRGPASHGGRRTRPGRAYGGRRERLKLPFGKSFAAFLTQTRHTPNDDREQSSRRRALA